MPHAQKVLAELEVEQANKFSLNSRVSKESPKTKQKHPKKTLGEKNLKR